jgi:hypothetical protein
MAWYRKVNPVKVTQFVIVKSEFSCNTKYVERASHENIKPSFEGEMFNMGNGLAWN